MTKHLNKTKHTVTELACDFQVLWMHVACNALWGDHIKQSGEEQTAGIDGISCIAVKPFLTRPSYRHSHDLPIVALLLLNKLQLAG
jgi:hypothetical protein